MVHMKHSRLLLSLSLLLWLDLGCHARLPEPGAGSGLGADPEGCRSFATLGSVDVGLTPGELSCRFDAGNSEYRCELSAGLERRSSVTEYASVADFVEAGHTLGKLTSLGETRTENGHTRRLRHHYDELGRVVRSLEQSDGANTITVYSDHDGFGRPRAAVSNTTGGGEEDCGARALTIEYSESSRSVSRRSRPVDPQRCGFVEETIVERYDEAGNPVQRDAADGAGVSRAFVARQTSASERVCL
jgi:hypothetical protein